MIELKLIRVVTGEEVIAELVSETDDTITVQNGLVVLPNGQSFGFMPWATVIDRDKPEITLDRKHVIYIAEVDPTVTKKYNELYGSKIITPEDKKRIV